MNQAGGFPDSHCHLDMEEFRPDLEAVLDRARAAGIGAFLCPADISNDSGLRTTLDLAARHPDIVEHLQAPDILVDGMRGRSAVWYRVRVNLIHVPEADPLEQSRHLLS